MFFLFFYFKVLVSEASTYELLTTHSTVPLGLVIALFYLLFL